MAHNKQYRELRQSRLFITYSLHRPITSEDEGRFVLTRMAAACDYMLLRVVSLPLVVPTLPIVRR